MKTSESINEIATALAKAQGEIQNPAKDKDNPFFKSKYADLAEVLNVIRPAFSSNGLAIVQTPFTAEGGNIGVTTMIVHASGQWMSDSIDIPVQGKNLAQESGACISYLRRYSASAFAGVAQEDLDGNLGKGKADNTAPVASLRDKWNLNGQVITFDQVEIINKMIKDTDTDTGAFCQYLKVQTIETMPPAAYNMAVKALESKMKKMGESSETA
tara:strand:- start:5365 stop:6006 length:642 start_codon:yes stop_codon:yes gene_type:complete